MQYSKFILQSYGKIAGNFHRQLVMQSVQLSLPLFNSGLEFTFSWYLNQLATAACGWKPPGKFYTVIETIMKQLTKSTNIVTHVSYTFCSLETRKISVLPMHSGSAVHSRKQRAAMCVMSETCWGRWEMWQGVIEWRDSCVWPQLHHVHQTVNNDQLNFGKALAMSKVWLREH